MTQLTARSLRAEDDLAGLEPVWDGPLDEAEARHAELALVVIGTAAPCALALGRVSASGWRIDSLFAAAGVPPADALAAIVLHGPDQRIDLLARDSDPSLEDAVHPAGFRLLHRQIRVVASLAPVRRPAHRPLTFRGYADVGRRGLLAALCLVWGDGLGPTGLTPELELDCFLELARTDRGGHDTSLWRVAYLAGQPAGAVLALRLPDDPTGGVLLYIGVIPELRGRGLGAALHAEALWSMRRRGVLHYEDSTTPDNLAMRRIFDHAGCATIGSSVQFVRQPAAGDRAPATPAHAAVAVASRPRLPLGAQLSLLRKAPCNSRSALRAAGANLPTALSPTGDLPATLNPTGDPRTGLSSLGADPPTTLSPTGDLPAAHNPTGDPPTGPSSLGADLPGRLT